ncbi:hypothetical protein GCM10027040_31040 [Halomonas shantousis]
MVDMTIRTGPKPIMGPDEAVKLIDYLRKKQTKIEWRTEYHEDPKRQRGFWDQLTLLENSLRADGDQKALNQLFSLWRKALSGTEIERIRKRASQVRAETRHRWYIRDEAFLDRIDRLATQFGLDKRYPLVESRRKRLVMLALDQLERDKLDT